MLKHILIIRLSALGDVAMTLPVIYALARQYPHLQIDVLTQPAFAQLFVNHPDNVNLFKVDLKKRHKGVIGICRLIKELSSLNPDCVADLHNVQRSWLIDIYFLLRGKKVAMVDKQRMGRGKVLYKKKRQVNFINRYVDVFSRLGLGVTLDFCSVFSNSQSCQIASVRHPAIGIAPFARYLNKIYPLDKMRRVVELLCEEGFHLYLFGSAKEAMILEEWQKCIEHCTSLAGRFSLSEELSVISCMDIMITMDSANQHLASLAGTRVLTIWGSTTPACGFLGYGQSEADAMCLYLPCQPCSISGSNSCKRLNFPCLRQISPEAIVTKVKQLI